MKMFTKLTIGAAILLGASLSANATPVTYSFTADWSFEANAPGSPPGPATRLFASTDILLGTFDYDSEVIPVLSGPNFRLYGGATTNLSATVGAYSFSIATMSASNTSSPIHFLNFFGNTTDVTIGDWTSTNFVMSWSSFLDPGLPAALPPPGAIPGQISLNFINAVTNVHHQVSFAPIVIAPVQVPEPDSLLLIAIGLLLLATCDRRLLIR